MSYVDWRLLGPQFSTCNCDFSCPCQFNALPTYGDCRAAVAMQITKGHFADVSLDGARWVGTFAWPKAIHEGNGTCQVFLDVENEAQKEALLTILSGQETAPGATIFQVFSGTITEMLEPQFVPISVEVDIEARKASVEIKDVLKASGTPIVNPMSGEDHRVRVVLPNGFEYTEAEYGSGSVTSNNPVKLNSKNSHAHFFELHMTQNGVVR